MEKRKRLCSAILALCLLLSLLPGTALAAPVPGEVESAAAAEMGEKAEPVEEAPEESGEEIEEQPSGQAGEAFAADAPTSGTCGAEGDGSNVNWVLNTTGVPMVLTITGTGAWRTIAEKATCPGTRPSTGTTPPTPA